MYFVSPIYLHTTTSKFIQTSRSLYDFILQMWTLCVDSDLPSLSSRVGRRPDLVDLFVVSKSLVLVSSRETTGTRPSLTRRSVWGCPCTSWFVTTSCAREVEGRRRVPRILRRHTSTCMRPEVPGWGGCPWDSPVVLVVRRGYVQGDVRPGFTKESRLPVFR